MSPPILRASRLDELVVPNHGLPGRYRGVDRRRTDSYRLPLQTEIVDTELGTVEIQDLSVGGTGLLISSADPGRVAGRSLDIPLGPDGGLSARLEVVRTQWD